MTNAGGNLYNKIETFVFFDLETTDLIRGSKMPKITELSMIATSRNSIRPEKRNKLALPRILHKLTIPICPMQPINPQASYISNLWNDSLNDIKPFNESTYNMIIQFIERLPGLVCFVAHNGNCFDYPVFLSEIEQLKKTFPDTILCVDTFLAFKEFFSDTEVKDEPVIPEIPLGIDEVDEEQLVFINQKINNSLDDCWNDSLCSVLDKFDKVGTGESINNACRRLTSETGKDVLDSITNTNQNDCNSSGSTTPKSNPKSMQAINEKTPENQIIRSSAPLVNPNKILGVARKKLNFNKKPNNFKLSTVYAHMIECPPENLHSAEGDCLCMLRCVCQIGEHFAEWADCNAVSLNHFKPKAAVPCCRLPFK